MRRIACALCCAVVMSAAIAQPHAARAGTPSFRTPTSRAAVPDAFAVVDLDADGNVDIVGIDVVTGALVSALGDGHGGFQTPVALTSARVFGGAQAVGDLNGDGFTDVIALSQFGYGYPLGSGTIFLGRGNGGFRSAATFAALDDVLWAGLADANEDGHPDLLVVTGDYTLALYPGTGGTTFGKRVDFTINSAVRWATMGDMNGDGHVDVLALRADHAFVAYLGDGTGRFTPSAPTTSASFVDDSMFPMAMADVDGDGKRDLELLERSGNVIALWRARGDGTFEPWRELHHPDPYGRYLSATLADLDHDGRVDVVASTDNLIDGLAVWRQGAPGEFDLHGGHVSGGAGFVGAPDLNHDGVADLVMSPIGNNDHTEILVNHGDGTFNDDLRYALSRPVAAAVGDVDHDGRPDLVVALYEDSIQVLRGTAAGFEPQPPQYAGLAPQDVKLADMDGDGWLDIVVANGMRYVWQLGNRWTNTIAVLRGRPGGAFDAPLFYATADDPVVLAIADLNRDGRPDVLACHGGTDTTPVNVLSTLLNTGSGFPALLASATFYPASESRRQLAVADFDADGNPDVLASGGTYLLDVYQGHADGTLTRRTSVTRGFDATCYSIAAGQFTSDAVPDAVLGMRGLTELYVLPGGQLTFPTSIPLRVTDANGFTADWVDVADADGDGHDDILVAESEPFPNQVSVFPGRGNGTFDPPVAFPLEARPWHITAADVDGDGDPDVVAITDFKLLLMMNQTPHGSAATPHDSTFADVPFAVSVLGRTPVTGPLRLACALPDASPAAVALLDVTGRRRWSTPIAGAGRRTIEVPGARALAPGVYFVELRQGDRVATRRIVLTH